MAGVWSLDNNGTLLTPVPDISVTGADSFAGGQPGYWDLINFVPIWFQASADGPNYFSNPPNIDWLLGDIVTHTPIGGASSVSWTSPENALADISISVWNPRNFGRDNNFELTLNNVALGAGIVGDSSDRANRVSLSVDDVPISVGDILALTFSRIDSGEDYVGMDFNIVTRSADSDGDGVDDDVDFCPDTAIPEVVPTVRLNPNHWALTDDDAVFDTVANGNGRGPNRSYITEDTAGCSCEQIIAAQGLGYGHTKHGCSISAMDDWVEFVTP